MDKSHVIKDGKAEFRQRYWVFNDSQFEAAWALYMRFGPGPHLRGIDAIHNELYQRLMSRQARGLW